MQFSYRLKLILAFFAAALLIYYFFLGAPKWFAEPEFFVVPVSADGDGYEIARRLKDGGFIRSEASFRAALVFFGGASEIEAGGYRISKAMNALQLAFALTRGPQMKWVTIPEGLRKEEIAEILSRALSWSEEKKEKWIKADTEGKPLYEEGVYFPDTYLIPVDEDGKKIAERMIANFNEKFAPYLEKFLKENVRWDTALKIASLVQREAASEEEMPLIAGILWNRLEAGMKLDIDATVQYIRDTEIMRRIEGANRGKSSQPQADNYSALLPQRKVDWWAPIRKEDKDIDSPYNTYRYRGLPPRPISNPGIAAIEAVLNPLKTRCFYYLHDGDGKVHCAETYEEHLSNIAKYLK